jgi:hypothetical protein
MKQAKQGDSIQGQRGQQLPTAVQAMTIFVPPDPNAASLVEIKLLNYAIFTALQLTSVSKTPFTVVDLIVNGEFHPLLTVSDHTDWFMSLRMPKLMDPGSSFRAVLQAPVINSVKSSRCYPKLPMSVMIVTSLGNFTFLASEGIRVDVDHTLKSMG